MNASPHTATFSIPAAHPAFAGHFPGRPIVPGVMLLDAVARHVGEALGGTPRACTLSAAKFLRPVGPDEIVTLAWRQDDAARVRFTLHAGDALVANGLLEPR